MDDSCCNRKSRSNACVVQPPQPILACSSSFICATNKGGEKVNKCIVCSFGNSSVHTTPRSTGPVPKSDDNEGDMFICYYHLSDFFFSWEIDPIEAEISGIQCMAA